MKPVLNELPAGIREDMPGYGAKEAAGYVDSEYRVYHYCGACGGWIEGEARQERVNDMRGLGGRSGTVWYCKRCDKELGFFGAQA